MFSHEHQRGNLKKNTNCAGMHETFSFCIHVNSYIYGETSQFNSNL